MVRYILLAFFLGANGTTPFPSLLTDLLPVWFESADTRGHWDPWGIDSSNSDSDADSDAGNHWDPWG